LSAMRPPVVPLVCAQVLTSPLVVRTVLFPELVTVSRTIGERVAVAAVLAFGATAVWRALRDMEVIEWLLNAAPRARLHRRNSFAEAGGARQSRRRARRR